MQVFCDVLNIFLVLFEVELVGGVEIEVVEYEIKNLVEKKWMKVVIEVKEENEYENNEKQKKQEI